MKQINLVDIASWVATELKSINSLSSLTIRD